MRIPFQLARSQLLQQAIPLRLRAGHGTLERSALRADLTDEYSFDFEGIGFAINANVRADDQKDHVPQVEVFIDGTHVETVKLVGEDPMARMLAGVALGDFVSYYLALRNGADPSALPGVTALKRALSK